jgi:flagellar basal body-associated protein FliL
MKKKSTRLLAVLAFVVTIAAVGAMQYFNTAKKGQATEEAAEAVGAAANAALDWAKDTSPRNVEVVTLVGQTPQVITVRTLLTMKGPAKLSEVCASLPRVRDAINVMLFDGMRESLRRNGGFASFDLVSYETPLKEALNRSYDEPTIDQVRLSRGNAAMGDTGCTEKSARKGGGGGGEHEKPHQTAEH